MLNLHELDNARVRWQLGHQLFFGYVQALILACTRLQAALDASDWPQARREMERATQLLWGVSVTFKLTGGFSQAAYDGYVRPNMFEASDGFSGLWSHDHDYLVKKVLRGLKPIFQNPPPELADAVQTFQQAFAIMYDSHKYVCQKFEGDAPSLLMGDEAQKSAGEMIDTFKRNRLLVLGVPA